MLSGIGKALQQRSTAVKHLVDCQAGPQDENEGSQSTMHVLILPVESPVCFCVRLEGHPPWHGFPRITDTRGDKQQLCDPNNVVNLNRVDP
jgi:hypothetical protein